MTNDKSTNDEGKIYDIQERCFNFAMNTISVLGKLPRTIAFIEFSKQLIRSASSTGANMEEADAAVSRRDFINKVSTARKEAKESNYWLRLILSGSGCIGQHLCSELEWLKKESNEITRILSSIIINCKSNHDT